MKKTILTGTLALVLGMCINNYAISNEPSNLKIAVVDVQKVVSESKEVNALKKENQAQIESLTAFVEKAKADLQKETDKDKRQKLEEKYNKQLNDKKAAIDKAYAKKLEAIDKNITSVIVSEAKADGYDLVLAKGIVLFGGIDITKAISKAVK